MARAVHRSREATSRNARPGKRQTASPGPLLPSDEEPPLTSRSRDSGRRSCSRTVTACRASPHTPHQPRRSPGSSPSRCASRPIPARHAAPARRRVIASALPRPDRSGPSSRPDRSHAHGGDERCATDTSHGSAPTAALRWQAKRTPAGNAALAGSQQPKATTPATALHTSCAPTLTAGPTKAAVLRPNGPNLPSPSTSDAGRQSPPRRERRADRRQHRGRGSTEPPIRVWCSIAALISAPNSSATFVSQIQPTSTIAPANAP
jgi:hypothetical protein